MRAHPPAYHGRGPRRLVWVFHWRLWQVGQRLWSASLPQEAQGFRYLGMDAVTASHPDCWDGLADAHPILNP